MIEIKSNKEMINLSLIKQDQSKLSLLAIIIVIELVLGGSGRVITIGSFISLRYFLFFIAVCYFVMKCFINDFKIKNNLFYFDIMVFFFIIFIAIAHGIFSGYELSNVIKSSQGYFYLLMYFPMSLLINNKKKSKKVYWLFINCSVILAIITFVIFLLFYLNHSLYYVFTPILDDLNYGYISLRGGLPAVFLKSSPLIAVSFILLLIQYINLKTEKNYINILKLIVLLFGIVSTMSMGLWIATLIGVLLTINLSKGKYKLLGLILVILLMGVSYYFLSDYITTTIGARLSSNDSSFIIKYDQFFRLIKTWSKGLVFGNGFGIEITFMTELGSRAMINFELFWLQLLVNMGLIGFFVYIRLFIKSFYYTFKMRKKLNFEDSIQLKSLNIGLIVLIVISSVNPFLNNPIGIGYLIIVLSTISVYFKEKIIINTVI
ncbi:MAG: hypothetical protein WBA84_00610 [Carnobacterium sp.]|uniref:hypothetical protein n=1 Tax=Carnobacterium sp. TaxID=48221 RepID=UPI003C760649